MGNDTALSQSYVWLGALQSTGQPERAHGLQSPAAGLLVGLAGSHVFQGQATPVVRAGFACASASWGLSVGNDTGFDAELFWDGRVRLLTSGEGNSLSKPMACS